MNYEQDCWYSGIVAWQRNRSPKVLPLPQIVSRKKPRTLWVMCRLSLLYQKQNWTGMPRKESWTRPSKFHMKWSTLFIAVLPQNLKFYISMDWDIRKRFLGNESSGIKSKLLQKYSKESNKFIKSCQRRGFYEWRNINFKPQRSPHKVLWQMPQTTVENRPHIHRCVTPCVFFSPNVSSHKKLHILKLSSTVHTYLNATLHNVYFVQYDAPVPFMTLYPLQ